MNSPDYSRRPRLIRLRSAKGFIVAVVFCMAFTDVFLYGLVVPVIPRALQSRLGLSADKAQTWTSVLLAVYGGALLLFAPCFGYLADHSKSRRMPLVLGLSFLAGATAMLCVGTSITLFITGRILQGMSAAMVWTVGLALLADTVDKEELGKCLGYITLAMNGGTLLGPLLGGVVYDKGGYYAVFAMAFVLLGSDIVLRLVMVEKKIAKEYTTATEGPSYGTSSAVHAEGVRLEAIIPPGPSTVEDETSMPISGNDNQRKSWRRTLPPVVWLLGSRRTLVAMFATMVFGVMITGFDAVLPLFVMQTFNWSSNGSGLIFLPVFLPSIIGPFVGHLTDKHGPRFLAAAGFLLALPSYVLLRLIVHKTLRQEVFLCALLAFIGSALALVVTPIFTEIVQIVHEKEVQTPGIFGRSGATAQAYGLFNVAFATGTIFGPLLAGFVKERSGWGAMSLTLGLLSAGTSVPVFLDTGGWIGDWKARRMDNRATESSTREA